VRTLASLIPRGATATRHRATTVYAVGGPRCCHVHGAMLTTCGREQLGEQSPVNQKSPTERRGYGRSGSREAGIATAEAAVDADAQRMSQPTKPVSRRCYARGSRVEAELDTVSTYQAGEQALVLSR